MNLCDPCRLHQQANPKKKNLHTIKSTTSESPVSGDTESEANLNCTIALMGCGYRLIVSRWYFYPHCSALMFSQEFKDWHWGIDFQQNTWQRLVGSYWFYGQTQMKNWCPWYAKKISRLVRLRAHLLRDVLSRNFYGNPLKLSELQQLEVGIRVQPNFPIIILILLTGFINSWNQWEPNSSAQQWICNTQCWPPTSFGGLYQRDTYFKC